LRKPVISPVWGYRLGEMLGPWIRKWGYGKGYVYAHNEKWAKVEQEHLPKELLKKHYYQNSYQSQQQTKD